MKLINCISALAVSLCLICGCSQANSEQTSDNSAELVIYGSIYTADDNNPYVEAIAVKNGRFVYSGDKTGVRKFIGVNTKVNDYTGKGMVMPGCTEAHSHFLLDKLLVEMGAFRISEEAGKTEILAAVKNAYSKAKASGKKAVFGFGWNIAVLLANDESVSLSEIDDACPDIPLYFSDEEFHKAFVNTVTLKKSGILNDDGTEKISEIEGGEIKRDAGGKINGLLTEQAANYVRINLKDVNDLITKDMAKKALIETQKMLHSEGYVYYMDGWPNYFNTETFYEAARELENSSSLYLCIGLPYEFDSYVTDISAEIEKASGLSAKYNSQRINTKYIKIFMDGTFAGRTAFTLNEYPDVPGNPPPYKYGLPNWTAEKFSEVTQKANNSGFTMHVHTMGDAAVRRCVDAFAQSGRSELRNTLVHVQNVDESDFQRIKDNNVCCAVGILWHATSEPIRDVMKAAFPEGCKDKSYPIKSHLDCKTNVASSSDYPALSGAPWHPFKIMKIAVTGQAADEAPWNPEECCTREDMLKILTINGAYQMHLEKERGSIVPGKYADFIYADQDVFAKDGNGNYLVTDSQLMDVKVIKTYFEGK
ncbi:MAG: amidohydrolase family protein [Treponema sp.]|nr:amidohydrolase family protein [Candidatus Treponema merdequi]